MDKVNFIIRKEVDEEKVFTNPEVCKACGGICCKTCGCSFSPEDFYVFRNPFSDADRLRYIIAFLKRGYASIDHAPLYNKIEGAIEAPEIISFPIEAGFKISYEKIMNGDGALYLRMRNNGCGIINAIHLDDDESGCVLLTEKGCPFTFKKRPKGGRTVQPKLKQDGYCIPVYSEVKAAMDWYPYQHILFKAYEYFLEF